MSKAVRSPMASPGLAAATAGARILAVGRGLRDLIAEHSLALNASADAALPRRLRAHLRALYAAPHSKRGRAAVKRARLVKASQSAPAGRFALGLELAVLIVVVGILAVVAV